MYHETPPIAKRSQQQVQSYSNETSVASFFSSGGTQSLGGLFNRIFVIEALAWYVVMASRMLVLERG
jgi:ribosomal protein L30E